MQNGSLSVIEDPDQSQMKSVLKRLVCKANEKSLHLDQVIIRKLNKQRSARGWVRPTGIKVAPLKLLDIS
jgi:hypothetical protein